MGMSDYMRAVRARAGHDLLLLPAVSAVVVDVAGRVLLHRAVDTGNWHTIGGVLEPGEAPAAAAVREVFEETGVTAVVERLVGVYTTPEVRYPNGDLTMYVVTTFRCRPVAGEPIVNDDESLEVRYFAPDELPTLRPDQALRVAHALADCEAYFEL
ncbi:MAG: hydrolase [Cyanobacteria bacterium RYN_339]|nr:hydrolase [Cyanobacteria bacterium RYN_339]